MDSGKAGRRTADAKVLHVRHSARRPGRILAALLGVAVADELRAQSSPTGDPAQDPAAAADPQAAPDPQVIARAVEEYLAARDAKPDPWDDVLGRLSVYGDMRLRQEASFHLDDQEDRNRTLLRARAGALYQLAETLHAGFRLATGNPDDANSGHVTLGDGFDKLEINLDRAFVSWRPQAITGLDLTGGKFPHSFHLNPVYGELVWDEDVQPEGAFLKYSKAAGGTFNLFEVSAGQYLMVESSSASDAAATVAQVHTRMALSGSISGDLAVGYYHYQDPTPDGSSTMFQDNQGNAVIDRNGDGIADDFASDFGVLNPIASISTPAAGKPLVFSGEWMKNLRAEGDRDEGFAAGVSWGAQKQRGDWRYYYQWQVVEQDAVFSPVSQDDFLHATNFRGHALGLQWKALDKVAIHLWSLISAREHRGTTTPTDSDAYQWRVRLDLNIRF